MSEDFFPSNLRMELTQKVRQILELRLTRFPDSEHHWINYSREKIRNNTNRCNGRTKSGTIFYCLAWELTQRNIRSFNSRTVMGFKMISVQQQGYKLPEI